MLTDTIYDLYIRLNETKKMRISAKFNVKNEFFPRFPPPPLQRASHQVWEWVVQKVLVVYLCQWWTIFSISLNLGNSTSLYNVAAISLSLPVNQLENTATDKALFAKREKAVSRHSNRKNTLYYYHYLRFSFPNFQTQIYLDMHKFLQLIVIKSDAFHVKVYYFLQILL